MNEPIQNVYFVESGMVSLMVLSEHDGGIETGVIGQEGVVGSLGAIGTKVSPVQASVQITGQALKCSAAAFVGAYASRPALQLLVNRHIGHLLVQAQQNALCHALHSVKARLCRWLLQTQDIVGSRVFELTQEFLSNMLGVQRTSVSITAHSLQVAGLIRYRRGRIEILNRPGLEEAACECYRLLNHRVFSDEHPPVPAGYSS